MKLCHGSLVLILGTRLRKQFAQCHRHNQIMAVGLSVVCFLFSIPLALLIVPPKTPVLTGCEPVAFGSDRELLCDASQPGAGLISYEWYKYSEDANGVENWESTGPIGTGLKYVIASRSVSIRQTMFHPHQEKQPVGGKYKCRASNAAGSRDSDWRYIYVYVPCQNIQVNVSQGKPAIGSVFSLNCHIPSPSGGDVLWMRWRREDLSKPKIVAAAKANIKKCLMAFESRIDWSRCSFPHTFNIQVTVARSSDVSAYWICWDTGLGCQSNPINAMEQGPATKLVMVDRPSSTMTGYSIKIKCETDSYSGYVGTISWYRKGTLITSGVSRSTRKTPGGGTICSSVLTLTAKRDENQAEYECRMNNQASLKKDVALTVYFPPDGIQLSETNVTIYEGESKTITCSTTSSSNPVVRGISIKKKLGDAVVDVTGTPMVTNGAYHGKDVCVEIKLDAGREDDGAQYICSFTYNSTTSFTKTATVKVKTPAPRFTVTERRDNVITVTWTTLPWSYTKLQIRYCINAITPICGYHLVADLNTLETSFVMNKIVYMYEKKGVICYLEVYHGSDLVYQSSGVESPSAVANYTDWMMYVVVGATCIVLPLAVCVGVLLHRRSTACVSDTEENRRNVAPVLDGGFVEQQASVVREESLYLNQALEREESLADPTYMTYVNVPAENPTQVDDEENAYDEIPDHPYLALH